MGSPSVSSKDPFKLGIRKHFRLREKTYSEVKRGEKGDEAVSDENGKVVDHFVALNLGVLPPRRLRASDPRRQ